MNKKIFRAEDGIDEDTCLSMYDNDPDFYMLILDAFYKDCIRTSEGMKETYEAGDKENYSVLVHGLKGAGGSAGAKYLVEISTRSNDLMKADRFDQAYEMHEDILNELDRLITLIPERISGFKEN